MLLWEWRCVGLWAMRTFMGSRLLRVESDDGLSVADVLEFVPQEQLRQRAATTENGIELC